MWTPHLFNRYLVCEAVLMFGALPLGISLMKPHGWIYILLWLFSIIAYGILKKHYAYRFRDDWNAKALNSSNLAIIILRFLPVAVFLLAFTWLTIPSRLFSLPLEKPFVWGMVMLLYPVLSAFPQEIIYRSFFFRRYGKIISIPMINIFSALTFGWVHIVLQNWVAVVFSIAGGMIFSDTYSKTRSLAVVCFEHALYGCYIFTIGLGYYFYHGNAVK